MEPIFFEPVYKEVIWGGNSIARVFEREISGDNIGESWEISAHPNGVSKIKNENIKEEDLLELFNNKSKRKEIFGLHCETLGNFPILIKFIDARENLSIQVHPDDDYAKKYENDSGKTECWYILDCKKNAKIIYGFKDNVTKENLKEAIYNIEDNIQYVNINKGDFIQIPAGTIHAIMEGTLICEIQQSSDATYRVFDWNRVDKNGKSRQLHKEKAFDVINIDNNREIKNYDRELENKNMYRSNIFSIDMIKVKENICEKSSKDSFFVYIVIEGKGSIKAGNFKKDIRKGTTFLIPSMLGSYEITGDLKMLKIWI